MLVKVMLSKQSIFALLFWVCICAFPSFSLEASNQEISQSERIEEITFVQKTDIKKVSTKRKKSEKRTYSLFQNVNVKGQIHQPNSTFTFYISSKQPTYLKHQSFLL